MLKGDFWYDQVKKRSLNAVHSFGGAYFRIKKSDGRKAD
jgi:hypothetical protein